MSLVVEVVEKVVMELVVELVGLVEVVLLTPILDPQHQD
jgi:hypothetical protein